MRQLKPGAVLKVAAWSGKQWEEAREEAAAREEEGGGGRRRDEMRVGRGREDLRDLREDLREDRVGRGREGEDREAGSDVHTPR